VNLKDRIWIAWWNLKFYLCPSVRYAVITKVDPRDLYDEYFCYKPMRVGTYADGSDMTEDCLCLSDGSSVDMQRAQLPVFSEGEILLINRHGREICGHGRKPSKWNPQYEIFWRLSDAILRVKRIQGY